MKNLLSVSAAVLVSLSFGLQAQEQEEAPNLDAPEASAKPAANESGARNKKAAADLTEKNAENRKNPFTDQQKKIEAQMTKFNKAKKASERRRIRDSLAREQHNLEVMMNRKLKPYQDRISPLKERIRISSKNTRPGLERELAALEADISQIKKDADLEKWCKKVDGDVSSGNTPNPGPGKKMRSRRSKKNK